MKTVHWRNG